MRISVEKLLASIRKNCLICCGNSRKMVDECGTTSCPLHPYRSAKAVKVILVCNTRATRAHRQIRGQTCFLEEAEKQAQ